MLHNLSHTPSILGTFVAELRDATVQQDPMRFRFNLKRLGNAMAVEVSKSLAYVNGEVQTPLAQAPTQRLVNPPVLSTILRAGLPMHEGVAEVFDRSEQAFVSACRDYVDAAHSAFKIRIDAVSAPPLAGRVLFVTDPMLATGESLVQVLSSLFASHGSPSEVHVLVAIASEAGVRAILKAHPNAHVWAAAVDAELNAQGYIVPGLGDAGDLAFGSKM